MPLPLELCIGVVGIVGLWADRINAFNHVGTSGNFGHWNDMVPWWFVVVVLFIISI